MIRMFVHHAVNEYASWKAAYDAFDAERTGMGVIGQAVFQSTEDPNDITAWHDFETKEAAEAFVESQRLREVMESSGVSGDVTIWFTTPGA